MIITDLYLIFLPGYLSILVILARSWQLLTVCCVLCHAKVIRAKKAGDDLVAAMPPVHEHISSILPIPEVDDYLSLIPPPADISAFVPQADENYEIFDGIFNSLPDIPVADVRYSDFFDPFSLDMSNPGLNANNSANLATHFHDERTGLPLFPNPKSGPLM